MMFGLCLITTAAVLYWVTFFSLSFLFFIGPSAMFSLGPMLSVILVFSELLIWLLIPVVNWGILRRFRPDLSLRNLLFSVGIFLLAIPFGLSTLILLHTFTDQKGAIDLIHTVKSGAIIPWLMIALGFPYMERTDRYPKDDNKALKNDA